MTKQDLLARAKELGVVGRHEMSKDALERAIESAEMLQRSTTAHHDGVVEFNPQGEDRRQLNDDTRDMLETRARELGIEHPEALDLLDLTAAVRQRMQTKAQSDMVETMAEEIKPKRKKGTNLNSPWQRKYYYLDLRTYSDRKATGEVGKAPMQVQLILKYMAEHEVTSNRTSRQGVDICSAAVAKRYLATKIEPHVLFAYYRKRMEGLGLVFAGYNVELGDPEESAEADDAAALEDAAEDRDDESEREEMDPDQARDAQQDAEMYFGNRREDEAE